MSAWAEVFRGFDARASTIEERALYVDRLIEGALGDREYLLSGAGVEATWAWAAAHQAFAQGNWIATTLCCHAVCERVVAGRFHPFWMNESDVPPRFEYMGLGRLIGELLKQRAIDPAIAERLVQLAEVRKPFGHWKPFNDSASLFSRTKKSFQDDPTANDDDAILSVLVDDATNAIAVTAMLLYGEVWS